MRAVYKQPCPGMGSDFYSTIQLIDDKLFIDHPGSSKYANQINSVCPTIKVINSQVRLFTIHRNISVDVKYISMEINNVNGNGFFGKVLQPDKETSLSYRVSN